MKRSTFLQNAAAIAGGSMLSSFAEAESSKKRSFRFAHITDIHVKPDIIAETGMAKALHHVQSKSKIELFQDGTSQRTMVNYNS